jgi:hypothetical protein
MRVSMRVGVTAMLVVLAAAYVVSAQQASPPVQDLQSLAGRWVGWATPTSGANVALEVDLKPDGSYRSMWGSRQGAGIVKMEGGKLMAEGQLITGAGTAAAGTGRSELTVTDKDGKQTMSGNGRDNQGPYSFRLTKQ